MIEVKRLTPAEGHQYLAQLAGVLFDCVEGGASVGFVFPFTRASAEAFFLKIIADVENGSRILLAAFLESELVGTVQVVTAMPPNQTHRADIAKLLVRRSARSLGVASQLMRLVEETSRAAGKTLLVLDTVTGGDGERLYARLGWTKVGVIPNYAVFPDGRFCSTTIFYKELLDA